MPVDAIKEHTSAKELEGFTQFPNKLLDHLCKAYIPARERQCMDLIIRKTYGYQKQEDKISYSQFVSVTGLQKRQVRFCLSSLEGKNIIFVIPGSPTSPKSYSINENFDSWGVHTVVHSAQERAQGVHTDVHSTVHTVVHHKRKKERLKKGTKKIIGEFKKNSLIPADYFFTDYHLGYATEKGFVLETVEAMFEKFKAHHEAKGSKFKSWNAAWRTWILNQIQYHGTPAPLKTHTTTNAEILA